MLLVGDLSFSNIGCPVGGLPGLGSGVRAPRFQRHSAHRGKSALAGGPHLVHIDLSLLVVNKDPDCGNEQVELLDVCPRHNDDLVSLNVDHTQQLPAALETLEPGRACR